MALSAKRNELYKTNDQNPDYQDIRRLWESFLFRCCFTHCAAFNWYMRSQASSAQQNGNFHSYSPKLFVFQRYDISKFWVWSSVFHYPSFSVVLLLLLLTMYPALSLSFLYLTYYTTANVATVVAQQAQQPAVAACRTLISPTVNDGTTVTTSQFPDPSCWDTLNMTDWMTNWNATTTVCTATQSVHTPCQCRMDEPWGVCFMRLTYAGNKTATYGCTDLTKPDNCTGPTPENVVSGGAEIFYGAFSVGQPNSGSGSKTCTGH